MITETKHPNMKKIVSALTAKIDVKELANVVRDSIKENFDKGMNADGSRMRPIAQVTVDIKRKQGGIAPAKPLIFKGGSQKGIQSLRINKKEAQVVSSGMAKNYFKSSGDISSKDMLKFQAMADRKPFGVSDKALKDVIKLVKEQLGR